jgi:hypothetical protein
MGVPALNQLHNPLQRDLVGWSQQQMYVFRHKNKRMQLKRSLTPVAVQRLQENLRIGFHDEESRSLPG